MATGFPDTDIGRHLAWYFETRAKGRATLADIDAHFAPEYRWDWGSPREERARELWFQRWRNLWSVIDSVEELETYRYVVTTRVGGGGVARIWFEFEDAPPHRILRTATSEAKHADEPGDVARDTAVRRGADGGLEANIHPAFTTPGGPFGGYLAALALRGAGAATDLAVPRSMACHFLSVGRSGPVEIVATTLRQGRRLHSIQVELVQGTTTLLTALVWASASSLSTGEALGLEPPEPPGRASTSLFRNAVELRPADGPDPHSLWCRTANHVAGEDPWLDSASLLLPFDSLAVRAVPAPPASRPEARTAGQQLQTLDTTFTFVNADMHTEWSFARATATATDDDVALSTVDFFTEDGSYLGRGSQQVLRRAIGAR